MQKITQVIFPNKPQLDIIAAYWLATHYGADHFPGIAEAQRTTWEAGESPDEHTLQQWRDNNVVSFDIAGGTFDHHGTDDSVTLLVAKKLGVEQNPELQSLLRYAQEDDLAGLHNNFGELAGIIKAFYEHGEWADGVVDFTLKVLDALQHKQKTWHVYAKEQYEQKAKIFKIKRGKNKLKLAVIKTDNTHVANYAKQTHGVAVVVQKNHLGHIFIFTNAFYRVNLRDVVAAIRFREAELTNKKIRRDTDLRAGGKIQEVQNWFFHESLNAMMNGSEALANTVPTKLSLEEVTEIVIFGVSEKPASVDRSAQAKYDYYNNLFKQIER